MEIEKTRQLACDLVYWFNINRNSDIENAVKNYPVCLDFQATQTKDEMSHHDIPNKLLETVCNDILTINDMHYLCTVDYHSKFPVIKQIVGFSADNLVKHIKLSFSIWVVKKANV